MRLLTLAALAAVSAVTSVFATDPRKTPNVVFIMADDLGDAELGCFGQKRIKTPSIDRMAGGGMKFTRF